MQPITGLQRWVAALIAAGVAVQFLLAGAGAFGATSFKAHTGLGWAIAVASLLALVIALLARREVRASGILFAGVVVQVVLGVLGEHSSTWFGALHGLNALVVAAGAANLARRTAPASGNRVTSRSRPIPPEGSPSA
jgi:hypothetical protein